MRRTDFNVGFVEIILNVLVELGISPRHSNPADLAVTWGDPRVGRCKAYDNRAGLSVIISRIGRTPLESLCTQSYCGRRWGFILPVLC